jgi:outer membrane protein OmpA-like peptidoglycan-associated protein
MNIVLGCVSSSYAEFDPPRISYVANPDGRGAERTYYLIKGLESSINMGDALNVYRMKRPRGSALAVRVFIGTMVIVDSQHGSAMGHFTTDEAAMANPSIRHHTAMMGDIVVPILVIKSGIFFEPGTGDIGPNVAQEFDRITDFVKSFSPSKLIIEGHTDSDGDEKANQALSELLAEEINDYLIYSYEEITPDMIETHGYGETRPIVPRDTPENKALNRRIEIFIWE